MNKDSIFKKLVSLFSNKEEDTTQADHEEEIKYRMGRRSLDHQAAGMLRTVMQCREEARRLELKGDHTRAVAKAAEAANMQKLYDATVDDMVKIDAGHAVKQQAKVIRKVKEDVVRLTESVVGDDGMKPFADIELEHERARNLLEESTERMEAFVSGISTETSLVGNIMGEEALASIMADSAAAAAAKEPAAFELPEEGSPEWVREHRRALEEFSAE